MKILKLVGVAFVFIWFMGGGVMHFTNPEFFLAIMPPFLPFHDAAVYVSGVFEIIGALGLLHPRLRQYAGWGLFALTIVVTPVNIYMWMTPEAFPGTSQFFLSMRLVVQVFLLACIWWSTSPTKPKDNELALG